MGAAPALEVFAANRACGRIAFEARANCGITRRWRVREEGPLRLRCPGSPSPELEAVILNTAGGILGYYALSLSLSCRRASVVGAREQPSGEVAEYPGGPD